MSDTDMINRYVIFKQLLLTNFNVIFSGGEQEVMD